MCANVKGLIAIKGEIDFILKCVAPDLGAFQDFIINELTAAPNVDAVKTSLAIRRSKFASGVPIEDEETDNVKMRVTIVDVPVSTNKPVVYMSKAKNMPPLVKGSKYTLPNDLIIPGEQVVVSEVLLSYNSPIGGFVMSSGISVSRKFHLKPRYGNIDWDDD